MSGEQQRRLGYEEALVEVFKLHVQDQGGNCATCKTPSPCSTAEAVAATGLRYDYSYDAEGKVRFGPTLHIRPAFERDPIISAFGDVETSADHYYVCATGFTSGGYVERAFRIEPFLGGIERIPMGVYESYKERSIDAPGVAENEGIFQDDDEAE